jgi:hypothetical protein
MELVDILLIIIPLTILELFFTYGIFYIYVYRSNLKPLISMGRRFAASMGEKSGESKRAAKLTKTQVEARGKVTTGIIDQLPFKDQIRKMGLTDEQIIALLQDEDFMKGLMVASKTISGLFGSLKGAITGNKEDGRIDLR